MDQSTARKLAIRMRERTSGRSIYIAITVDHLEGRFDGAHPVWVVINIASPWDRITEVPRDIEL